ncbi:hypothetical protein ID855_11230 [Xenorhabdus sp. ZM]|nr:hypothetical protein [Xenorhabdus sp. ZM]MBD2805252.1 hypothetical protein [Xenorhabdus sp. ZM]
MLVFDIADSSSLNISFVSDRHPLSLLIVRQKDRLAGCKVTPAKKD